VATRLDGEVLERHETVTPPDLTTASGWLYRTDLSQAQDVQSVAVVVEDLSTGQWGGAAARFAAQPIPVPSRRVAVQGQPAGVTAEAQAAVTLDPDAVGTSGGSGSVTVGRDPGTPRPSGDRATPADGRRPLVLVPPAERPVRGRARFRVLASSYAVARVEFFLDGISVASDDRAPFVATLDLGPDARTATVQAVAYDSSGGRLGEHALVVNAASQAFDVRVTGLAQTTAGAVPAVRLDAQVTVPPGQDLARVEIFWNEELASVVQSPAVPASGAPVTISETLAIPTSGRTGSDYLRVVATLGDGSLLEDVQLLSADIADRVEVNLVEIFAVVRDRAGAVVTDLEAEDFRVTLDGDEIGESEGLRFRRADDVPLVLGLLVDTSESMWPLMIDTRQTASRFVLETVRDGDRAFLVEFDNQPRLVQETTDDVALLLRRFRELEAGGATALYDAVVFSLVEIEAAAASRRALVLITDGDDYGSKFGSRRAIRTARELGTPIYGISLAPLYRERGSARAAALEALTDSTGGRTFSITDTAELARAFAEINLELRSQYILTFPTRETLDDRALRELEVEVPGRAGARVRTVIGER
jgi:VWFA-related protein